MKVSIMYYDYAFETYVDLSVFDYYDRKDEIEREGWRDAAKHYGIRVGLAVSKGETKNGKEPVRFSGHIGKDP